MTVHWTRRILHIPSWPSVRKFTKMAAGEALYGHGMAMFRIIVELRQQLLHMAHFINAKPISDHHPMNMFQTQDGDGLSCNIRVKLDETGNYAGIEVPQCTTTVPLQP